MMNHNNIPLREMLSDLEITNREILQYSEENKVLIKDPIRNKLQIYLNEGRIIERKTFVEKLQKLIKDTYPNHK